MTQIWFSIWRFLPNPFYEEKLRTHTGREKDVKEFVLSFPRARIFLEKINELVNYIAPYYLEQDKKQLVIAIGCTGGVHRSVVIAEELHRALKEQGHRVTIEHRDIGWNAADGGCHVVFFDGQGRNLPHARRQRML